MSDGFQSPPSRPVWLEEMNRMAKAQEAVTGKMVSFDVNSLHAEASRNRGGLSDFGANEYLTPLFKLTRALEEEANLHHVGALVTRDEIVNALECRLWVEDVHRRFPEAAEQDLGRVVFVAGPGRSGTSIAHEALAATPDTQFVTPWEMRAPWIHEMPEEQREQAKDEAFAAVAFSWYGPSPSTEVMHQMWRDMPQECAWAMNQSFATDYFSMTFYRVPTFQSWIHTMSVVPTYRQYKRYLQAIQQVRGKSDKYWVLKTPQHTFAASALFEVFPEANFVWMHRDPYKTIPSSVNMMREFIWGRTDTLVDPLKEGATFLQALPGFLNGTAEYQKSMPLSRLSPVVYHDFIKDPATALASVLENFGLRNDAEVKKAIADYMASRSQHSRSQHAYGYDMIGITDIDAAYEPLKEYFDHFGVKREW